MSGTKHVDNFQGKLMMHDTTYTDNLTIATNHSGILVGPITVSGNITVPETSNLTIFNNISVTGTLDISGNMDVR